MKSGAVSINTRPAQKSLDQHTTPLTILNRVQPNVPPGPTTVRAVVHVADQELHDVSGTATVVSHDLRAVDTRRLAQPTNCNRR